MVQKSFGVFFFFFTCTWWKEAVENTSNLLSVAFQMGQSDFSTTCMLKRRTLFVSSGAGEGGCGAEDEHPLPALGHLVSPFLSIKFKPHYVGWCQNTTSPSGQQAAEDHTRRTCCQTTLLVENVGASTFALLCKQRESCVPWVVLCNVTMFFFFWYTIY